jgi:hypothetical protein
MTPLISLREALADPALLGSSLAGDSWAAWRTLLIAAVGAEGWPLGNLLERWRISIGLSLGLRYDMARRAPPLR